MKDEIINYWDKCSRQGMALQRGMYFKEPPAHGVILMSRRPNAPYADEMSPDESILIYEGHDVRKVPGGPDPKSVDQPRYEESGRATQNGRFADWVDNGKSKAVNEAIFRVYEKIRPGIWTDRGLYALQSYAFEISGFRNVFKFKMEQALYDSSSAHESQQVDAPATRQIPSWIKQEVHKRDKGKCVICNAADQLHFDHDFPFAKGGTSIIAENVRILCARHNLSKSDKIE